MLTNVLSHDQTWRHMTAWLRDDYCIFINGNAGKSISTLNA